MDNTFRWPTNSILLWYHSTRFIGNNSSNSNNNRAAAAAVAAAAMLPGITIKQWVKIQAKSNELWAFVSLKRAFVPGVQPAGLCSGFQCLSFSN